MIRSVDHKFTISRRITKHKWGLKRHRNAHFVRRKLAAGNVWNIKIICPHDKVWILGVEHEMPVKKLAHAFQKSCLQN